MLALAVPTTPSLSYSFDESEGRSFHDIARGGAVLQVSAIKAVAAGLFVFGAATFGGTQKR